MHIGLIDPDRLKLIPKRRWAAHEFCFHLHDLIVHLTKLSERIGAGKVSVKIRDQDDLKKLQDSENPISFLAATGRTEEERRLMVNHICGALLPDMMHFVHGGLIALEKRKFTVALTLLRKPFKEGLPLLALMCSDEEKFHNIFKKDTSAFFDGNSFNAPAKKEVLAAAIEKCEGMEYANADVLYSILFNYGDANGLAGIFDKATHLFTKRTLNATEDYNINFIFKNPLDDDIYDSCYKQIAYVILFIHLLQIELLSRIGFPKTSYLEPMLRSSVGAYEAIFGTGRSKMIEFFNREFRDFMTCPACNERIHIRRPSAAKFFVTETLQCHRCKHEHQLPVSWIFSRVGRNGED